MRNRRTTVIQTAGLIGAGAAGGLIAVLVNATYRGGADAGDWLQFFGGMLGAALAVTGAVYFERQREIRHRRTQLLAFSKVYAEMASYLDALSDKLPDEYKDNPTAMKAGVSHFKNRIDAMLDYCSSVPVTLIDDMDILRTLTWSKNQFQTSSKFAETFLQWEDPDPNEATQFKAAYEKIISLKGIMHDNCTQLSKKITEYGMM